LFVAGLGDDILTGNGGTHVFNAGAGHDTIIINNDNLTKLYSNTLSSHLLARVDGGGIGFAKHYERFACVSVVIGVC
jgi:Ca2+-binding RTX toxin-like protein